MDLLSMLMNSMTTESSLGALAEKTGASQEQMGRLVGGALPALLGSMTQNASTEDGAKSLLNALTQHTNTTTLAEQITDVDEEDGGKIIGHILGGNSDKVVTALADETGMNQEQVTRGLGSMAPALLSVLSAATGSAAKVDLSDGIDLTDLLGMFGGQQQSASTGLLGGLFGGGQQTQQSSGGLLSSLFGGGQQAQPVQQPSSGGLLSSLFGGGQQAQPVQQQQTGLLNGLFGSSQPVQQQPQSSGLGSLLGGLFGGGQQVQPQQSSAMNGTQLLSILTSLMK